MYTSCVKRESEKRVGREMSEPTMGAEKAVEAGETTVPVGERPAGEKTTYETEGDASHGSTSSILKGAKAAAEREKSMTLREGIRLYPKAIAWSVLISTCIVMEGYDISLVTNFCEFILSSLLLSLSCGVLCCEAVEDRGHEWKRYGKRQRKGGDFERMNES